MGMIQANLNHLMLSIWGGAATLAGVGSKIGKGFKKPVQPQKEYVDPKLESSMADFTANIGKRPYGKNKYAIITANAAANDMIDQKATASFSVADRLSELTQEDENNG